MFFFHLTETTITPNIKCIIDSRPDVWYSLTLVIEILYPHTKRNSIANVQLSIELYYAISFEKRNGFVIWIHMYIFKHKCSTNTLLLKWIWLNCLCVEIDIEIVPLTPPNHQHLWQKKNVLFQWQFFLKFLIKHEMKRPPLFLFSLPTWNSHSRKLSGVRQWKSTTTYTTFLVRCVNQYIDSIHKDIYLTCK